ncbi:hypothetical protein IQ07DRAFT_173823 [Pyrenochaeta sp. DS3sAY3a]|nr:hypothetical protein IQ07DRAFT_173823 [Pyrenochaeta sp. DS3sAY3a]
MPVLVPVPVQSSPLLSAPPQVLTCILHLHSSHATPLGLLTCPSGTDDRRRFPSRVRPQRPTCTLPPSLLASQQALRTESRRIRLLLASNVPFQATRYWAGMLWQPTGASHWPQPTRRASKIEQPGGYTSNYAAQRNARCSARRLSSPQHSQPRRRGAGRSIVALVEPLHRSTRAPRVGHHGVYHEIYPLPATLAPASCPPFTSAPPPSPLFFYPESSLIEALAFPLVSC